MPTPNQLLTRFRQLPRRTRIFILLLPFSLLSLAFLYSISRTGPRPLSSRPTPTSPPPIQPLNPGLTSLQSRQILLPSSVTFPDLPPSLPIHSASTSPLDTLQLMRQLADYFHLTSSSSITNFWTDSAQSQSLSLSSPPPFISYLVNSEITPSPYTGPNLPTPSSAIATVKTFLSAFPDWSNFSIDTDHLSFLHAAGPHFDSASADDYDLIALTASPAISGFPLRLSGYVSPYFLFYIGQNNRLVKITLLPQNIAVGQPVRHLSPITPAQATSLLQSGQAQIIHTNYFDATYLTPAPLPPITINAISLEYRLQPQPRLLVPYFTFTGTFTPSNSSPVDIYLTLPAVDL